MVPMVHTSYDTRNRITVAECTLYRGGTSPGRNLLWAPGWSPMGGSYVHNWVVSTNFAWFPKWECRVDTLRLFPWWMVPHCIWELRSGACIILSSIDWIHGWMMSNYWIWMMSNCWIWMMSNCWMWTMNNHWMWVLDNEGCVSSWCLLMFSC